MDLYLFLWDYRLQTDVHPLFIFTESKNPIMVEVGRSLLLLKLDCLEDIAQKCVQTASEYLQEIPHPFWGTCCSVQSSS